MMALHEHPILPSTTTCISHSANSVVLETLLGSCFFLSCQWDIVLGITLIFVSLHSYNSVCNRGSVLVLVIRLIRLQWELYSNLQILLDL